MRVIYVVEVGYNDYDDFDKFSVVALETIDQADQYVKDLTAYINTLHEEYMSKMKPLHQIDFNKIGNDFAEKARFDENKEFVEHNHTLEQELLQRSREHLGYDIPTGLFSEKLNLDVDYYEVPIVK